MRALIPILSILTVGCFQKTFDDARDRDGDGFQSAELGGDDCDDDNPEVNPSAQEVCGDTADNNCDGETDDFGVGNQTWFDDVDADGVPGATASQGCRRPSGSFTNLDSGEDCDDTDPDVRPGRPEVCGDGIDNDCNDVIDDDGVGSVSWYTDQDADGFTSTVSESGCTAPSGALVTPSEQPDCDDNNAGISPAATEICGNLVDDDCDDDDSACRWPSNSAVSAVAGTHFSEIGSTDRFGTTYPLMTTTNVGGNSLSDLVFATGGVRIAAVTSPPPMGDHALATSATSILSGGALRRGRIPLNVSPLMVDGETVLMYAAMDSGNVYYLDLPLPAVGDLSDLRQQLVPAPSETRFGRAAQNGYGFGPVEGNGTAYLQGEKLETQEAEGYAMGLHIWPTGRPSRTVQEVQGPIFLPANGADIRDMVVVDQDLDGLDDLLSIGTTSSGGAALFLNRGPVIDGNFVGHSAIIELGTNEFAHPRLAMQTLQTPTGGVSVVVAEGSGARLLDFPASGTTTTNTAPLLQPSLTADSTAVVGSADFDGDGFTDVATASVSGSIGVLDVYFGPLSPDGGQMTYQPGSSLTFGTDGTTNVSLDAQVADLNGDDRPDLVIASDDDAYILYGTGQ